MMVAPIETPIKYERLKKSVVLDKKVFKICEIKEKEVGRLRKRLLFIHCNGKIWDLLLTNLDVTDVKHSIYYQLE